MFRPDRATLRSAGFVVLLTGMFLMVNSQVVYAAGSNSETGDLLAPLNITSSEGVAINGYELNSEGGSIVSLQDPGLGLRSWGPVHPDPAAGGSWRDGRSRWPSGSRC